MEVATGLDEGERRQEDPGEQHVHDVGRHVADARLRVRRHGDEREQEGKDGKGDKESDKKGGNKPKDGESPEDAARRILRENADFEKGALNPGRLEYRQPDKDW